MKRILFCCAIALLASCTAFAQRLPGGVTPSHYNLSFNINFPTNSFEGDESIDVTLAKSTTTITLEARWRSTFTTSPSPPVDRRRQPKSQIDADNEMATFTVDKELPPGTATIHIKYTGHL